MRLLRSHRDENGSLSLSLGGYQRNALFRNNGDGTFERIGRKVGVNDVGWAYGTGAVDLNGDGFQEIYAPVGFQSVTEDKPDG